MSGPVNLGKVEQLRARDRGRCWLCDGPIDFNAEPNSSRAPSIEHLVAKCHGGPDTLENLVLCHPPCNRKLNNLPLSEKIKLRETRVREQWLGTMRKRIGEMLLP